MYLEVKTRGHRVTLFNMFQKSFLPFYYTCLTTPPSASATISSFSFLTQMWVCRKFGAMTLTLSSLFLISNLLDSFCLSYLSVSNLQKSVSLIIITVCCIMFLLVILPAEKQFHLLFKAWAYYFSNSTLNSIHLSFSSCLCLFHIWFLYFIEWTASESEMPILEY